MDMGDTTQKLNKKKQKQSKKKAGNKIFSIKWKVFILIMGAVLLTSLISLAISIPVMNRDIANLTHNYMEDLVVASCVGIDNQMDMVGISTALSEYNLEETIGSSTVADTPSSYMYAVSADGTMLYHPTKEKIGQPVENAAVKQVLGELEAGNHPTHGVITYDFKGVTKYAAYAVGIKEQHILVLTADKSDIMSGIREIEIRSILGAILSLIVCGVVGLLVTTFIVNPILAMSKEVERLSTLDFTKGDRQIRKTNDETALMAEALRKLREQLCATVKRISEEAMSLNTASDNLNTSAEKTATNVEHVETAIHEIAEGATNQAQETQDATENIIQMGLIIEETGDAVETLRINANQMLKAGQEALDTLNKLDQINKRTKTSVDEIYVQTNKTNEAALKIMQATDIIAGIAEETNLLSLNASIEAARAGESGRGFAVVASEIQKLAEQSNSSANEIADIIRELIEESEKSVQTMNEMKQIIVDQDQHVSDTESAFESVKAGIDKSIEGVDLISSKTQKLGDARVKVVDAVQDLTAIAQENAASAQETSAAAAEVSNIMLEITEDSSRVYAIAESMREDMDKMKTE